MSYTPGALATGEKNPSLALRACPQKVSVSYVYNCLPILHCAVAEVLAADQWQRWHAGKGISVEEYFAQYPGVAADADAALLLVYGEFLVREECGETPSAGEYLARFHPCAEGLRHQLDFHAALEMPPPTLTAPVRADSELAELEPIPAESSPRYIGRYRLERVLGKGNFGLVFLAHDDQLQRFVAIEAPHRKIASQPQNAEAYLIEARTVAGLDHPNIVPVYDQGSSAEWPCYVVESRGGNRRCRHHLP